MELVKRARRRCTPVFAVALAAIGGCGAPQRAEPARDDRPALVLLHATVVDPRTATPQRDVTIVVRGDRIVALGPGATTPVPPRARVVDATGKFVIPGLWDMHVHLVNRPTPALAEKLLLPLYLAHGVVGVRDMGSDFERIRALREGVARGALIGPRIVAAGPFVDGPQPAAPFVLPVTTDTEARAAVRTLVGGGADFVKVQAGLSRASFLAIAEESARAKIPFVGHVPEAIDAREVVDAGQRSIEHVSPALTGDAGILLSCSREVVALRTELLAIEAASAKEGADPISLRDRDRALKVRMIDTFDPAKCGDLFARMVAKGTRVVPTLIWSRQQLPIAATEAAPASPYAQASTRDRWREARAGYLARSTAEDFARNARIANASSALVLALHRAGVPVLAGTDSFDAFVLPGQSLHEELALLVEAGLSPREALSAATLGAATFLGAANDRGLVAEGKLADLVVLDADPIADIHNVARVHAVMLRGVLSDRAELDRILAGAAEAATTL